MKTHAERVQVLLVNSGEHVHSAAMAFQIGGVRREMRKFRAAAPGVAVLGTLLTLGQTIPADAPTLDLPAQMVVALTNRRLLFYSLGGTGIAKAKKLVHEVDRADLAGLEQPAMAQGVFKVLRVGVLIRGGAALRFEFPRLSIAEGSRMLDEIGRDFRPA